jgi:hypothetical protein
MSKKVEHWFDYDHIFQDILNANDHTGKAVPLNVKITDVEHSKVYETPHGHKWCSWVHMNRNPRGVIHIEFTAIEGGPADLKSEYRWQYNPPEAINAVGISRTYKSVESSDGGKTWKLVGTSDASDISKMRMHPNIWIDEHTVLGTGGINNGWDAEKETYSSIGLATAARSYDDGATWTDYVNLNDTEQDMLYHESRPIRLRDGTIALPVYGQLGYKNRSLSDGFDSMLYFSEDEGRTWSQPLVIGITTKALSFEEPAVVELGNGDLLVMMRHTNRFKADSNEVYVNCGQVVVRKVDGQWAVGPHTLTPMGFRGHPVLLRTRKGVLICAGSGNQFNFSTDDGKPWSKTEPIADPAYKRHNHYPVLQELPDGRILSVYHLGNDWPYPAPEPEWIHATTFRVEPL